MKITILGKGCKNCELLEARAIEAAKSLGIEYTVHKIKDIEAIADHGVMRTPGLMINDRLVSQGRVLTADEIKSLMQ